MKIALQDALVQALGLMEQDRLEEAGQMLEDAVAQGRQAVGPDHPDLAATLDALGVCRARQGQLSAAEQCFQAAAGSMKRLLLQDDRRFPEYLIHGALACHQQGKAETGWALLAQAADSQKCLLPPDDALVTQLLRTANLMAETEGEPPVIRALAMAEHMYSRGYHSAVAAHALALDCLAERNWDAAKVLSQYELEALNEVFGPHHQYLVAALDLYGWIAEHGGETAVVIGAYMQELAILGNTAPHELEQKGHLLWRLAQLYRAAGNPALCARALQDIAELPPRRTSFDSELEATNTAAQAAQQEE